MTIRSYAKINLGLRVVRKRADGFHDIETIFRQVNNYDEIEFLPAGRNITAEANDPRVPTDASNLCVKAANLLRDITGVDKGVRIQLTKNIPVGAGLGGGSSNAAATLKGLVKFWGLALRPHELKRIALNLGSDVPFFLEGGSAVASGRGELLEHFNLELPYWILVVTPQLQISTTWAYAHLTLSEPHINHLKSAVADFARSPAEHADRIGNDFEPLVFQMYPEVANIKEMLLEEGAVFALMSGSGSSVFGLFPDEESANLAALKFSKSYYTSLTEPSFQPQPVPAPGKA
ncbi:MAG: 4-(cytidine 5'-diphospho)-2-C-methyl-D-erythritol kinase [Ignavibacteriales bacterium]|nr:4-(cytidine 5'-diphospho)-2-C-methyl-D-erythritol kinase [Ignavibacteriales bacterium]